MKFAFKMTLHLRTANSRRLFSQRVTTTAVPPRAFHDKNLYEFTRGRFVFDEANQIAKHRVHFDMNKLAALAAESVGAKQCVHVEKCPDGLYNKAYVLTMDDGKEVIGKVPNPNAGLPYYTTASEVATMDFARNILRTPTPLVYAWNAHLDGRNVVGSEYIIMEKMSGVSLAEVWWELQPPQKLKILLQIADYQRRWTKVEFTKFGSLFYAADAKSQPGEPIYIEEGRAITTSPFTVGPAVGREWSDHGRQKIQCDRGPWRSIADYRRAVGFRETEAIKNLPRPKQMQMVYGSEPLYQPSCSKKVMALRYYNQVLDALLPPEPSLISPHLWHHDLHSENIFVDPKTLQITGIIDWQSIQIAPLFESSLDPLFLDYEGPDVGENLQRPTMPENIDSLEGDEKTTALRQLMDKSVMISWRLLFRDRVPNHYPAIKFQNSSSGHFLNLSRRVYELGEAHVNVLLLDIRDERDARRAIDPETPPFPLEFTESQVAEMEADMKRADLSIASMNAIKGKLGRLWPEKGIIEDEHYEEVKRLLRESKDELVRQYQTHEKWDRKVFEELWPFDD